MENDSDYGKEGKKMKLKLTDNLFLKILSVLAAIILWLVVINISDAEATQRYNLEVTLLNTNVITDNGKVFRVEEESDMVKVTVRARRSVLEKLKGSDFTLTADVEKDLKYGDLVGITVECANKDIVVEEDVSLSRRNVKLSIEDSATEQFPVTVKQTGTENNGLVVGSMVPEQTIIKITGPVSIVERIKLVQAEVDVTGLPGTSVKNCKLKLYNSDGDEIDDTYLNYTGKSEGIDVTVSMLNTKNVSLEFSYIGTPAENYEVKEVRCKPEYVEIAGTSSVLDGLSSIQIAPEAVDVEGIDEDLQLVIDLTQYLPSGIILPNENDASILVIVELEYVESDEEPEEDMENPPEEDTGAVKPPEDVADEKDPSVDSEKDPTGDNDTSTDPEKTDTGNDSPTAKEDGPANADNEINSNNNNETEGEKHDNTESNS